MEHQTAWSIRQHGATDKHNARLTTDSRSTE